MAKMIEHYTVKDMSQYYNRTYRVDMEKMRRRQESVLVQANSNSLRKINTEDAAEVQVSELAKALYESSYTEEKVASTEPLFTESFQTAAEGFSDFSMKICFGNYANGDVSAQDINLEVLDDMDKTYNALSKQIKENYSAALSKEYMQVLDKSYNKVFEEKILNPIKGIVDEKLYHFQPDDKETMQSIKAESANKASLENMLSNYFSIQSMKKEKYEALSEGTKEFYELLQDSSKWHDIDAVKKTLSDTMQTYSSATDIPTAGNSAYLAAKNSADAIAKRISDQYAENLKENSYVTETEKNNMGMAEILADIVNTAGVFSVDFSKIENFDVIYDAL